MASKWCILRTNRLHPEHRVYPYLLRDLTVDHVDYM
jgi:hypothetical protein